MTTEQKISDLEGRIKNLTSALEFYANKENWYPGDSFKQSCRINENDLEYFPDSKTSDLIGGKLARSILLYLPIRRPRRSRESELK
jgi:hypothetical protein